MMDDGRSSQDGKVHSLRFGPVTWKPVSDLTEQFAALDFTDEHTRAFLADLGVNIIAISGPTGKRAEYFDWFVYTFAAAHIGGLRREYWEIKGTAPGRRRKRPDGSAIKTRVTDIDEVEAACSIIARRALSLQEFKTGMPKEYEEAVKRWRGLMLQTRADLAKLGEQAAGEYDLLGSVKRGLNATKRLASSGQ